MLACSKKEIASKALSTSQEDLSTSTIPVCDPGYNYNFYLKKCVPICSPGYHNDSITGACIINDNWKMPSVNESVAS